MVSADFGDNPLTIIRLTLASTHSKGRMNSGGGSGLREWLACDSGAGTAPQTQLSRIKLGKNSLLSRKLAANTSSPLRRWRSCPSSKPSRRNRVARWQRLATGDPRRGGIFSSGLFWHRLPGCGDNAGRFPVVSLPMVAQPPATLFQPIGLAMRDNLEGCQKVAGGRSLRRPPVLMREMVTHPGRRCQMANDCHAEPVIQPRRGRSYLFGRLPGVGRRPDPITGCGLEKMKPT